MKVLGIVIYKILFLRMLSFLLAKYLAVEWKPGSYDTYMLSSLRNCNPIPFHSGGTTLHQCMRGSVLSHLCKPLELLVFFHSSYSNKRVAVSYCGFNLHFYKNYWCWNFFLSCAFFVIQVSSLMKCLFKTLVH